VGIAVFDVNDVTVTNCTIEGFEAGIVVINSRRSVVEENTMSNISEGVVVMESSQNRLVGNIVNAPDRGVRVINTHGSEIIANETSKSAIGFDVIDSTGNTFNMNRAASSGFAGFALANANNNVFEANEVKFSQFGFVVTASNENTLEGNSVSYGTGWFSFGFQERSEGNTVTGNEATGGGVAFKVYIGAARNTFSENSVDGAAKGFSIDADCVGNVVELNTIKDVREMGLRDASRGGSGDHGTDNFYRDNQCRGNMTSSQPWGLCES
jgi:parallel beta-helix repeat protein